MRFRLDLDQNRSNLAQSLQLFQKMKIFGIGHNWPQGPNFVDLLPFATISASCGSNSAIRSNS